MIIYDNYLYINIYNFPELYYLKIYGFIGGPIFYFALIVLRHTNDMQI